MLHFPGSAFLALYHFLLMIVSIIPLSIGSALTRRRLADQHKYKTMLVWFGWSLLIIFADTLTSFTACKQTLFQSILI